MGNLLSEQCDKVLLDAPCSGEGMQYKSDVNIYQRKEKATRKLAHLQKNLLITGINALKKGGELVYSTCTTNTIENEEVILSILQELKGQIELLEVKIEEKSPGIVKIESNKTSPTDHNTLPSNIVHNITTKVARFRPHIHHTGGFFIAKFKKIKTNTSTYKTSQKKDQILLHNTAKQMRDPSIKKSNKTTRDYSKSLQKKVQSYLSSYFPQENITSHFLQNNKIH